jgi:hypothetical protein
MWDGLTVEHNTTALSSFVGADSPLKPPADRGLMDMDILSEPVVSIADMDGLAPAIKDAQLCAYTALLASTKTLIPGTAQGCYFCNDYGSPIPPELAILFTDIIESTERAAAALHSLFVLITASSYDKLSKGFNVFEEVTIAVTTSVRTPGPCSDYSCSGFITVATLIGVHLILVATISALFVGQVRYSRCTNTWHAVSQLMSEELVDALNQGNNAKDESITRALKRDGKDDFMKLGLTGDHTRIQVVKHADDDRRPSGDNGSSPLGVKIRQRVTGWLRKDEGRAKGVKVQ